MNKPQAKKQVEQTRFNEDGQLRRWGFISLLMGLLGLAGTGCSGPSVQDAHASVQSDLPAVTVHLAGDSTVMTYAADSQQEGWGQELGQFFNDRVSIHNQAKGGANVQSFRDGGRWDNILSALKAGDYVLFQFGANDSGTAHGPIYPDDFARILGEMAEEVKAKDATPILVTPSAFYQWRGGQQNNDRLAPYAAAMHRAGAKHDLLVADLNARGVEYLNSIGQEEATALYMPSRNGGFDKAHFVKAGATQMAQFVAEELQRIGSPLADYHK